MRIATVKATGDRYLVQRLDLPVGGVAKVHCWGEVVGFKTAARRSRDEALTAPAKTTHAPSKTFLRDAVEIGEDVTVTGTVAAELMRQMQRNTPRPVAVRSSFRRTH